MQLLVYYITVYFNYQFVADKIFIGNKSFKNKYCFY